MNLKNLTICLPALFVVACQGAPEKVEPPTPEYLAEIEEWRADREERLRKPDGWLSLVGLLWLEEGETRFGSAPENDLVFPPPAPEIWGTFRRAGREVWVEFEEGSSDSGAGALAEQTLLAPDTTGEPTIVEHESLLFYVIERGDRIGIRLKDSASELLETFEGMESYPVDTVWRLDGRFVRYDEPKTVQVPNIIGGTLDATAPGRVEFSIGGADYQLEPTGDLSEPETPLFLVFGDETNGEETYGGGRFLYVDPPDPDGRVAIDFNKAYNPPCVFTPYATCPLPRPENKLALRIEAGEKSFRGGVH